MRLYVYVSEAVKLSDLVPILESSQTFNTANGITGVLSYSYGHYLQVLQGEDAVLTDLVKKIQKDTRHQNMTEILDINIDQQFFTDWSMNLVPLLKRNESFINFIDCVNENIDLLSSKQKRLMKIFHSIIDKKIPTAKQANPFKPLSYSINEWPDFEAVEPSSALLSLCGRLMNNPNTFREIVKLGMYGTESEIRTMLNQLNKAGYLKVTQLQNLGKSRNKVRSGYLDKILIPGNARVARTRVSAA